MQPHEQRWFLSAQAGDLSQLKMLQGTTNPEQKIEPDLRDTKGTAALHYAAAAGYTAMVDYLMSVGANVQALDNQRQTPLHHAARFNKCEVIRLLITKYDAHLDARCGSGMTPLHRAVTEHHAEAVRLLVSFGASANTLDLGRNTPLHKACADGLFELVDPLLTAKADFSARDTQGYAPFAHALPRLRKEIWWRAARVGELSHLRKILAYTIGADDEDGWKDLSRALYHPEGQDTMKLNLHKEILNSKDPDGCTALGLATQAGHVEVVEYLLSQAAYTAINDNFRETPLHHAARLGHAEIASMLCDANAPIEPLNLGGCTPLHIAAYFNHEEVIRVLLSRPKVQVDPRDATHSTPLHYAASRGHVGSMKLLIDYGASLEARDKDGLTAIDLGREYHAQLTEPRPRLIEEAEAYKADVVSHIIQPKKPELGTYRVIHSDRVAVRSAPTSDAAAVGLKVPGEKFLAIEETPGWVKLAGEEKWIRMDGSELGIGRLLERVELSEAFQRDDDDDYIEPWHKAPRAPMVGYSEECEQPKALLPPVEPLAAVPPSQKEATPAVDLS